MTRRPHKLNLKVDKVEGIHVYCSLFMNSVLCGKLTFRINEYRDFGGALLIGAQRMGNEVIMNASDNKKFIEWLDECKKEANE